MNSDAATNDKKGFVMANTTARHPIKTTTEFAFAHEFRSFREVEKANRRFGGIVFGRLDI